MTKYIFHAIVEKFHYKKIIINKNGFTGHFDKHKVLNCKRIGEFTNATFTNYKYLINKFAY